MGFSIDFAPVGQGLTAIATAYHGGKVEDYRKKQEELVQIMNEINTATTPEAKQAAQAKLDAFATTIQGDPNLQQMYNQAASGVDKFQAAYDLVKQNQPNALHTKGSYGSDGRYNSGYDYDPSNSGFKFQGLTGMADMYNPLTGEKIFDSPEGGEFSDPQEFINTLRAATADRDSWAKAQLGGHLAKLGDPNYVASFPGMNTDQLKNLTIEDLVRLTPERSSYYKAKGEALEFGNPLAKETRAAKEDEELAFADRKEKQSINNYFNDWMRKRAITRADAKADSFGKGGKGKFTNVGTDIDLSRKRIAANDKRSEALRAEIADDGTLTDYIAREGIKAAGIRSEAEVMHILSTRMLTEEGYGIPWHDATDTQREEIADMVTNDLVKSMKGARVYDIAAQVNKAGTDLGKIPSDQWQNADNLINEYYTLEDNTERHRAAVTQKAIDAFQEAKTYYLAANKAGQPVRFQDILNQMQLEVSQDDIAAMDAAQENLFKAQDRMNEAKQGSKEQLAAQREMDIYMNEINGYVLTGGGDFAKQTIDPFSAGKVVGELPLRPDPAGIDPESQLAQQIFASQDQVDRAGKTQGFPVKKKEAIVEEETPVSFEASKGNMYEYLRPLKPETLKNIVEKSSGYHYFENFVETLDKGNMDSKKLRQMDSSSIAFDQFKAIAQDLYLKRTASQFGF